MDASTLDRALRAAHEAGDRAHLVTLYEQAAIYRVEAEAFYLTHAYVFALESGDPRACDLRMRLVALGADRPD